MVEAGPEFTLGIEEEYFLVDKETRNVVGDPPDVGIRIYKKVAALWFRELRVTPEVRVLLAPGGGVH